MDCIVHGISKSQTQLSDFHFHFIRSWTSLIAQLVKNLSAIQETLVQFLGQEDPSTGEGISYPLQPSWASLVAQLVKNLPAMQETWF